MAIWYISISPTMVGQALLALLLAIVGYILNHKAKQIHVLVNSRMADALKRIADLETKMGLKPGEPIPGPPIITAPTKPTINGLAS